MYLSATDIEAPKGSVVCLLGKGSHLRVAFYHLFNVLHVLLTTLQVVDSFPVIGIGATNMSFWCLDVFHLFISLSLLG